MARSAGVFESLNRSDLVRALLRHKLVAITIVVFGMALTAGYTASLPVLFRSTASVLIENFNKAYMSYGEEGGLTVVQDVTKAQRILAQSRPVIVRISELSNSQLETVGDMALPLGFEARVDGQLLYLQVVDEKA